MNREKTKLSVNINKIASLRNARGKNKPDLLKMAGIVLQSEAHGLTVHPRPDERHIRRRDVFDLKELMKSRPDKEFNIEGYPSPEFLDLVEKIKPNQCSLVPDPPEALTSNAGWDFAANKELLKKAASRLKARGIRVSLFFDPLTRTKTQDLAIKEIQPDRVEIYTESYAESLSAADRGGILSIYKESLKKMESFNIQANAGHDLNQENLFELLKALPEIKEVSIGQALISEALEEGLSQTITNYLNIIEKAFA